MSENNPSIWVNPEIPENTRHTRIYPKYPEILESKKDTRKYPIVFFDTPTRPEPDPLPGILSNTRPDPTRYWKTLPAGHWCQIVPLCLFRKKIIRISYGVIKCLIGINSKRIHGQSLFYLEGDGGGDDDGGGYNDDDADDDNGDGGGYIQLTIMIATCRSHRGFCAGFAV